MFPFADTQKTNRFPILTVLLILANIFVFVLELTSPDFELFISTYSFIPLHFSLFDLSTWMPLFTAAFMHASYSHILFNMLFLWVFGDNVEENLGPVGFLLFYSGAIIAATLLQYSIDQLSSIPNLGASGAIAGILGFYLIMFPAHRIKTLILTSFRIFVTELPAQIFLGYWAITQLFSGVGSLASQDFGGVAWFAHIGGFAFGAIVALLIKGIRPSVSQFESI